MRKIKNRPRLKKGSLILFAFLTIFFVCFPVFAEDALSIIKGPYLQNVTKNSIVVMWETSIPSTGKVIFRNSENNAQTAGDSESKTIHEIPLSGLIPGNTYTYNAVSEKESAAAKSRQYTFRAVPSAPEPWRFVVYGDTRSNPSSYSSINDRILKESGNKPAFILHMGDIVGDGRTYELWGKEFFEPGKELFATTPIWPCLGNHENNSEWYFKFFSLPNNERWYSFEYLNAHFIALDLYSDFKPGSEQYQWLEDNLKFSNSDWTFVFFHAAPYTSGPHNRLNSEGVPNEKEVANGRLYLDPLFQKYKVDMVFGGHDHFYERSLKGIIPYVTAGSAGAPLYDKGIANQFSQVFKKIYHYVICDLSGLNFKMYVKDIDGNIIDTLELTKTKTPAVLP